MARRTAVVCVALLCASLLAASADARSLNPVVAKFQRHQARAAAEQARVWKQLWQKRLHERFGGFSSPFVQTLAASAIPKTTAAARVPAAQSGAAAPVLSAVERAVLERINAVRGRHGLRVLRVSRELTAAARHHSSEMVRRGFFAHNSANGSSFDRRIRRFYRFRSAGENIAYGCPDLSASQALELWMNSPPHRRNILDGRWREIGIGTVHAASAPGEYEGDPATVVTTDFGLK